jgi:hypothetical protein
MRAAEASRAQDVMWPAAPCRGLRTPARTLRSLLVAVGLVATALPAMTTEAYAQRRPKATPAKPDAPKPEAAKPDAPRGEPAKGEGGGEAPKGGKPKVFDFTGIDLAGRLHTPQLLYFLERANEELERAFLERRSFIPHMVRSLEEEAL